jgi:hypothetical protein
VVERTVFPTAIRYRNGHPEQGCSARAMKLNHLHTNEQVDEFVRLALGQWHDIELGAADAGNAKARAMGRIAKSWIRGGMGGETLLPLLSDSSKQIRLAAAGSLVLHSRDPAAIEVLRRLVAESKTMVAPVAASILRANGFA